LKNRLDEIGGVKDDVSVSGGRQKHQGRRSDNENSFLGSGHGKSPTSVVWLPRIWLVIQF
jgi:hypothetical protein